MRNSATFNDWYADEVFLSVLNTLADGFRNFTCFTHTNTDDPVTVTYDNERAEAKTTTTFNNLCNAVDGYYTFL